MFVISGSAGVIVGVMEDIEEVAFRKRNIECSRREDYLDIGSDVQQSQIMSF